MCSLRKISYGLFEDKCGYPSNKFGEFGEVLTEYEQQFVSSLIWNSYKLTKGVDSKLYCCIALPILGKKRILGRLNDEDISYYYANSDIKRKMPVITCKSISELESVISAVWGNVRFVFFASNNPDILEKIELDWIETLESMPFEFISMVNVVVTQFFHGLWLEVATSKYSSPALLFSDIRDSLSSKHNIEYMQQDEW